MEKTFDRKLTEWRQHHEQNEAISSNLAEQLRMAGRVQRDFLPAKLPDGGNLHWASTFIPVEWVSGDFYDIQRVDEENIAFYIADVVGHGMPAALLTIFLKQAIEMKETTDDSYRLLSPAEVLTKLNWRLTAQRFSANQFVTCCYCILNVNTMELRFARGGHPYPVLIRANGQIEQLQSQGSLLGIFENVEFEQGATRLESGDKLILYSDGAEFLIGDYNNKGQFTFAPYFVNNRQLSIKALTENFMEMIRSTDRDEAELDDITTVGLQVV